jgi:hypothetical protein
MIVDTTISSSDNFLNRLALEDIKEKSRKQHSFPPGVYADRKERLAFRELYVREFLEKNGRDSDWDLNFSIVVWKDGEVMEVLNGYEFSCDTQSVAELLELPQN